MGSNSFLVTRVPDNVLFQFFMDLCSILEISSFDYDEIGSARGNSIEFDDPEASEIVKYFLASSHYALMNVSCSGSHFSVSYSRTESKESSFLLDTIDVRHVVPPQSSVKIGEPKISQIQGLIFKTFDENTDRIGQLFRNPKIFSELIASHQRQVGELQRTVLEVGKQVVDARFEVDTEYARRKAELEDEYASKGQALAKDWERKLASVDIKQKELDSRLEKFNDRDNTHVRRQIREQLKERLSQHAANFTVSDKTQSLRWPIHAGVWAALVGLGWLVFYFTTAGFATDGRERNVIESVAIVLKPLGLSIAMLGLGTWYLRWMNRWFERHSETEFQFKQFELDIDRASWVVETALEWKQEQNSPIPNHLLESVSRNLFSKSEKDESADMHPADYLASALLGKASGLRLALPGGGELEYGPKALREAGKQNSSS